VAYAPAEELRGEFITTSREGFRIALDVSVYSLIAVSRAAVPLMDRCGSIMTLSFYAAEKVVPNYNVMAVAKAGLESTVRYLAANLGSATFASTPSPPAPSRPLPPAASAHWAICSSPTPSAPRSTAMWTSWKLVARPCSCSNLSSAITGEILYVDCGYNIMGF